MLFEKTKLPGACVIELERVSDERGFFARSFCEREFAAHGLPIRYPQCNLSHNRLAGTLRGMHYQVGAQRDAKLVRCVAGAIYDVIVDMRRSSPTCLEWVGVELSASNGRALFVPPGFAHGFITLVDATEVFYQMGAFYEAAGARGVRWNDPAFAIQWPRPPAVIAERDARYADFDGTQLSDERLEPDGHVE